MRAALFNAIFVLALPALFCEKVPDVAEFVWFGRQKSREKIEKELAKPGFGIISVDKLLEKLSISAGRRKPKILDIETA